MSTKIIQALSSLGLVDKYKEKFEDEEVDDSVVEEWLQDSSLDELKTVISAAGHRTKFVKAFQQITSGANSEAAPQLASIPPIQIQENVQSPGAIEEALENLSLSRENDNSSNNTPSIRPPPTEVFPLPEPPAPIQIIEFVKNPDPTSSQPLTPILHREKLWAILSKVGRRRVSILSIAGPSRKGKSFILGFMLRYLKFAQSQNQNNEDDDLTSDWMGWKRPDEPLTGFSWRNGYEKETSGILMWSEPFNLTTCDGREFSIILMDTQGVFDEHTSQREWSTIVGLSLLTSSCLIFNIFTDIQEDKLQALENFMAFGLMAVDPVKSEDVKPFQKLLFLIRDWNNPDEFPYGEKGGQRFLDRKLEIKESHREDHRRIRQQLVQCFDQLECFLMPEPGENAKKVDYSGCLSGLEQKFAKNVEKFISSLLNIDEFPVKSIGGSSITGMELFTYFENYVDIFKSDETPQPKSLFEVTKLVTFSSLVDKSFAVYTAEMLKRSKSKRYFSDVQLQSFHNSAVEKAISFFEQKRKMGSAEEIQHYKVKIEEKITEYFQRAQEKNFMERKIVADEAVKKSLEEFQSSIKAQIQDSNLDKDDCLDGETIENFINTAHKSTLQYFSESLNIEEEIQLEFQEQQVQLENFISKLGADLKNENQLRRSNSERILRDEIEQLIKNYKENMNSRIENKFVPKVELEKFSNDLMQESLDQFSEKRGKFLLFHVFHDGLKNLIQTALENFIVSSSKENGKIILELDNKIPELCKIYKSKLKQETAVDSSNFEELHEDQKNSLINDFNEILSKYFEAKEDFENLTGTEEKTQLKEQYADQLLLEIEDSYTDIKNQLALQLESLLQSISDRESEALVIYTTAMDNFVQSNESCSDDQLESTHTREKSTALSFLSSALDKIVPSININSLAVSDAENPEEKNSNNLHNKINETQISFDEKCEKYFQDIKGRSKLQREHQESKARNELSAVEKYYSSELKKIADSAKTQDEFDEEEVKVKEEARKQLDSKLDKDLGQVLKDEIFAELEDSLREHYDETVEYFEMKLEEDKVAIEGGLITARKYYNDEMEKYIKSADFIHPNDLKQFSDQTLSAAVGLCEKTAALSPGQKKQLEIELASSFIKFRDQNILKTPQEPAIGIDLGTTYSCVAVYLGETVKIIPNKQGKNTTPSYVAFPPDGSIVIGEPAKEKAHSDPKNTIFDAKRLIGRKFDDPIVQKDMKLWPFEVVNERGVPKVRACNKLYHPEQISAEILKYLKKCAEDCLGVKVKDAVITVPAYFKDGQRVATQQAGELAGLNVLRIINEPTAAAIAYKLHHSEEGQRHVLIFDLGGGTFDVAIVTMSGEKLEVKAVGGDTHLGGEDFDNEMVTFCIQTFQGQTRIDLKKPSQGQGHFDENQIYRALQRIRRDCEKKKINLSTSTRETVSVDVIVPGHDLAVPISRSQFEQLNQPNFDKCIKIVQEVLRDAKLDKSQISEIVLVGGSTRIPKVQEMLKSFFGGKPLNHRINPDEAVAVGAAFEAAVMMGQKALERGDFKAASKAPRGISSNDVQPLSLGIEVEDGLMSVLIPRQSKVPIEVSNVYATTYNNQTSVQIVIYEGENPVANSNHEVGQFYLNGIPPGLAGQHNVKVTMKIDHEGITKITATCVENGVEKNLTVRAHKSRLSDKDIQKLMGS